VKCQKRIQGGADTGAFPIPGAAEYLADVVGEGGGRSAAAVGLMGVCSAAHASAEPARLELEQAVAQRNAELLQKNKELEEISLTDPLTGTRNRRYFYETIPTDVAQALRSHLRSPESDAPSGPKQELIFVLVDIDRFKRVNDEMGHAAGIACCKRWRSALDR